MTLNLPKTRRQDENAFEEILMTTTASLEQSLQAVESQLPKLEKAAEAEIAFILYNSAESNPWAGGCKRRDLLRQEVRDLRLQIKAIEAV